MSGFPYPWQLYSVLDPTTSYSIAHQKFFEKDLMPDETEDWVEIVGQISAREGKGAGVQAGKYWVYTDRGILGRDTLGGGEGFPSRCGFKPVLLG